MNKNLKMIPVYLMLITGAVTGIVTYTLHYEGKTALLILLGVLLFFYITGSMFVHLIYRFEKEQDEKEKKRLEEEGKVVEKNLSGEEKNSDHSAREDSATESLDGEHSPEKTA